MLGSANGGCALLARPFKKDHLCRTPWDLSGHGGVHQTFHDLHPAHDSAHEAHSPIVALSPSGSVSSQHLRRSRCTASAALCMHMNSWTRKQLHVVFAYDHSGRPFLTRTSTDSKKLHSRPESDESDALCGISLFRRSWDHHHSSRQRTCMTWPWS